MKYTSRELKSEATKKKLFVTAIDLISKKGYENVSINEICHTADLTKGAFYHYFNAKEDLLIQLFKDVDDYYITEVHPRLAGKPPAEQLTIFMVEFAYCGYGVGVDIIHNLFRSQTEALNHFMNDTSRPFFRILLEIVTAGRDDGTFTTTLLPYEIATYCNSFIWGLLHNWTMEHGSYDIQTKMRRYTDVVMRGLAP